MPGWSFTKLPDVGRREQLVHLTMSLPGDDLCFGLCGDVPGQVLVRQHDDLLRTKRFDDLQRVT